MLQYFCLSSVFCRDTAKYSCLEIVSAASFCRGPPSTSSEVETAHLPRQATFPGHISSSTATPHTQASTSPIALHVFFRRTGIHLLHRAPQASMRQRELLYLSTPPRGPRWNQRESEERERAMAPINNATINHILERARARPRGDLEGVRCCC